MNFMSGLVVGPCKTSVMIVMIEVYARKRLATN